ncbi:hypothetical protein N7447_005416 [Penicillium robsamsonii]|uniref:uncharacterized protein n=1 Tax=Penicillium robsamsonii TaxID=1792511 RepID=UPI00254960EB|nr:uncharacterized protein N7447_005416 [Penicillium robsamsonii]KAJ5823076.1 hypothetical protein N7447_005416 [Penicillium robsamsonii]
MFHSTPFTHQVPINNESENYVVGSELGLSGRFVRNLCDPVIQALMPLSEMHSVRFADIQALTFSDRVIPDIAFGLVVNPESSASLGGTSMVGEFKTPWTVNFHEMEINCPNPHPRLETLIAQMRMARVRYAFLTTYNFIVFIKRASDLSYLLSRPIGYDCQGPSLREMFFGFCLLSRLDPNYHESDPNTAIMASAYLGYAFFVQDLPPLGTPQTITPTSVAIECSTTTPVIINCVEQMSLPDNREKAVWLAEINGVRRVLKCWIPDLDAPFDNEAGVYHRLETAHPAGCYLFPKCIARQVVCSSLFPAGYVIIMEYREGERLSDIWYMLNVAERAYIENECLKAIHALREISIRLDDPGKHNVLYARESRAVTLIDFEVAAPLTVNTFIPTSYEMRKIFNSSLLLTGEQGG